MYSREPPTNYIMPLFYSKRKAFPMTRLRHGSWCKKKQSKASFTVIHFRNLQYNPRRIN
jgi:hypothetical protein